MPKSHVEEDGSVTVPAAVLRAANLFPGDGLFFEVAGDGALVIRTTQLREPEAGGPWDISALDEDDAEPMSTDEFMAWLDAMAGVPTTFD